MATPQRFNASVPIDGAFDLIGVKAPGEALPAVDAQGGLRRLNQMISGWSNLPLTFPIVSREVFTVTANQNTYTIGPGGDFDTVRPSSLTGAGLLLPPAAAGVARVEIPRALLTDDAYEAIQIKDLPSYGNGIWTDVYYNQTYAGGLGTIFLWPMPTTNQNGCVLYRGDLIQGFANLTTEYDFPPGYEDALEYGLAERLLTPYAIKDDTVRADVKQGAARYLSAIKAANVKMSDMGMDLAFTRDPRGGYNIFTGEGG